MSEPIKNHKNDEFVHYQKINIFGDSGVGKSTLIRYMQNWDDSEYNIQNEKDTKESFNFELSSSLVEDVQKIEINFNEDRYLFFNVYKSNLNSYDSIKINLDTILLQTECIIIMWDNSNLDTFDNIPNFIKTIEEGIKNNKFRNVPIFVIQNKMDLDLDQSDISIEENEFNKTIDNFIEVNSNIIYKKISLLDKSQFYELINEIYKNMKILEKDLKEYIKDWDLNNVKFKNPKFNLNVNENNNNFIFLKCLLLGNSTVGKTTFINKILEKNKNQIMSTVGYEGYQILAEIYDNKISFQLIDTAGQEKYRNIPSTFYKNADGILLFFDVTNQESFNTINDWIKSIEEFKGGINDKYVLFLIGNKIDDNDKRIVSKQQAKDFVEKKKIKYFECSCLKKINILEIINEIILMAYNKKSKHSQDFKSFSLKYKKVKKQRKNCCNNQ